MDALPADTPPRLKRLIARCLDRDRAGTLLAQRFDAKALRLEGDPVQLADDVATDPLSGRAGGCGRRAFLAGRQMGHVPRHRIGRAAGRGGLVSGVRSATTHLARGRGPARSGRATAKSFSTSRGPARSCVSALIGIPKARSSSRRPPTCSSRRVPHRPSLSTSTRSSNDGQRFLFIRPRASTGASPPIAVVVNWAAELAK